MAEQEQDFAALTEQSAAYRDSAIADLEAVAGAAETLGGALRAALSLEEITLTSLLLEGLNESLVSAELLAETLQAGLDLDATTLGEDGLLGLLSELTDRTEGVVGFFSAMSLSAQEATTWLTITSQALGSLFDLSQTKGIEQTTGILSQLGERQLALDGNRLLETANEQLANDERFLGLQTFLTDSFGLQAGSLISEQGLLGGFLESGLLSQQQAEALSLGLKASSVNEGLSLMFSGQKAEGEVVADGLGDKLKMTSQVFGGLSGLMQSENKHLFEVGKAAAMAEVGVNTALGAIKAYQSMASVPLVGPVLGAAAAAAVVVSGAKSIADISSQKPNSAKKPSATFKAPRPSAGGAAPKIAAPKLPNVAGAAAGGTGKEVHIHIADKPILETVTKAAKDGRLVIASRAIQ